MAIKNQNKRLTAKQENFVEQYLRLQNGTAAYKESHDPTGEMSDNVAGAAAWRELRKVKILAAIEERKEALRLLSPGCSIEEMVEQWSEEIRFDIGELVDPVAGGFCTPETLPEKARKIVQSVEVKEDVIKSDEHETVIRRQIKYRLPDRQKAKVELGKRIGFYPAERLELSLSQEMMALLNALTPECRDRLMTEIRRRVAAEKGL